MAGASDLSGCQIVAGDFSGLNVIARAAGRDVSVETQPEAISLLTTKPFRKDSPFNRRLLRRQQTPPRNDIMKLVTLSESALR